MTTGMCARRVTTTEEEWGGALGGGWGGVAALRKPGREASEEPAPAGAWTLDVWPSEL